MRWSRECGSDILSFNVLGQPIVVLNSVRAAVDLLDKRGANYSDRPRLVLFEVMRWRDAIGFLSWGAEHRKHRSMLQKAFQHTNIVQHRPLQDPESVVMLRGLLDNPGEWRIVIRRFTTAIILGITYGIEIESDTDPFVQIAEDASYALGHAGACGLFPFSEKPSAVGSRSMLEVCPRLEMGRRQTIQNAVRSCLVLRVGRRGPAWLLGSRTPRSA